MTSEVWECPRLVNKFLRELILVPAGRQGGSAAGPARPGTQGTGAGKEGVGSPHGSGYAPRDGGHLREDSEEGWVTGKDIQHWGLRRERRGGGPGGASPAGRRDMEHPGGTERWLLFQGGKGWVGDQGVTGLGGVVSPFTQNRGCTIAPQDGKGPGCQRGGFLFPHG